jgi:hypothetical protein
VAAEYAVAAAVRIGHSTPLVITSGHHVHASAVHVLTVRSIALPIRSGRRRCGRAPTQHASRLSWQRAAPVSSTPTRRRHFNLPVRDRESCLR